jgi:hypothetical protein
MLLGIVAAAALTGQLQTAHGSPTSVPSHIAGIVPPIGHVGPQDRCNPPCGGGDLLNHGGPTMTTNKTYVIYWIPATFTVGAGYTSTIDQLLR